MTAKFGTLLLSHNVSGDLDVVPVAPAAGPGAPENGCAYTYCIADLFRQQVASVAAKSCRCRCCKLW